MPKRVIEVPSKEYQPTQDEQEEVARIDATPEEVARRVLQPAEVREISPKDWRARRRRNGKPK